MGYNKAVPIGAGNWMYLHHEDRIKTPYTRLTFSQSSHRMPEFAAPGVGRESTRVTAEVEIGDQANGVIYVPWAAQAGVSVPTLTRGTWCANTT